MRFAGRVVEYVLRTLVGAEGPALLGADRPELIDHRLISLSHGSACTMRLSDSKNRRS
jgi:hypothetical protein